VKRGVEESERGIKRRFRREGGWKASERGGVEGKCERSGVQVSRGGMERGKEGGFKLNRGRGKVGRLVWERKRYGWWRGIGKE
jgi:hypothetical protein